MPKFSMVAARRNASEHAAVNITDPADDGSYHSLEKKRQTHRRLDAGIETDQNASEAADS